jgi:transposase
LAPQVQRINELKEVKILFTYDFYVGVVVGVFSVIITAIIYYLLNKSQRCPKCKTKLPVFRSPHNSREMLWGGWTCPKCRTEIDRWGNVIRVKKRKLK